VSVYIEKRRTTFSYKILSAFISFTFVFGLILPPSYAQSAQTVLNLPAPGTMVGSTETFIPAIVRGITFSADDPLKFDFIIDRGDNNLQGAIFEKEASKLIKYFLASLTVPEDEMWVNLSPYEKDRIIPKGFGQTEMGRDMLAQDYLLKQLTSSLMYPEDELGGKFWERVYTSAYEKFGTTDIPMNTFNKVWIVPKEAKVYENKNGAFVVSSHLDIMLEEDYLALESNKGSAKHGLGKATLGDIEVISGVSSRVVREVLIPEIEREVNQGAIFANLRQIYNSMILAVWYKHTLKTSLLGEVYVNQQKTSGVDVADKEINQKIYNQYVEAFKKGVYNYMREDYHPATKEVISRKYFSGGAKSIINEQIDPAMPAEAFYEKYGSRPLATAQTKLGPDEAMVTSAEGRHFDPILNFPQGQPISDSELEALQSRIQREDSEVRILFEKAQQFGIEFAVTGPLRGVDGPGSSLDLPVFQRALTPQGARGLDNLPSTPTIASEFTATITFKRADNEAEIVCVAPDYGVTEANPYRTEGNIKLINGRTPNGQMDAPGFIFGNLFGLKGVKITMESISPMALAGGMESSNVFNVALIAAASMLSGANLSPAEIFSLAVKLENDEFGGLTGGQGHLATLLGGAYQHMWLSGVKNTAGKLINPYGAVSVPLLETDQQLDAIENHMMLVQAGKPYKNGSAIVGRTAALINDMWTDLLRDKDPLGLSWHKEKLGLTKQYTEALKEGDFEAAARATIRYVEIRDFLVEIWLTLMIGASNNEVTNNYAFEYAEKVFNPSHPHYGDYQVIRDIFKQQGEEGLRDSRLYTFGPIAELVDEAKKEGIAVMPLGAGGPGANLIAIHPRGIDPLRQFLQSQGLSEISETEAKKIVGGTGTLKGFMPFKVGRDPMQFNGFEEIGLTVPKLPEVKTITERDTQQDLAMPASVMEPMVKGGIDFHPDNLDMSVDKDAGGGIDAAMLASPEIIERMRNVSGFVPHIIGVFPILNLPLLLGLSDPKGADPAGLVYNTTLDPFEKKERINLDVDASWAV